MSNKEDVSVENGNNGATTLEGSLWLRKIEFHLARKPFSSLPSTSDFKLETLNPSTPSNSSQSLAPSSFSKPELSDFVDSFLDPELTFRVPFQRIGAGLHNLGNTCFLNSVLQCLTYTQPLVAYMESGKHQNTCRVAGFCALCAIQKHVSRALQSSGRIVAPKDLVSNLRCISRIFRNSRQEDAHEYMIHLLESMHRCCLPSGVPAQSPAAYEKSLVHKIFGGRLRSQVKCLQCNYCSNTFDPFLDLSLEIMKADSMYKALQNFTAREHLDGGERQYKCERCKHKVKALKQLTIYRAPYVLAIHLKRFRSHFGGQKIDKKVHFTSMLDLKPFVTGAYEGDLKFALYGVLVHAGWSTHSGHYYCFVRTSSGLWYLLDDNRVSQVSEKTVLEQKAYMLFYVRDRKNPVSKKAIDIVQKESLIATMRNASSSCSIPGVKVFQNGCIGTISNETIPSSLVVKNSESSGTPEKHLIQKVNSTIPSKSVVQPRFDSISASSADSNKKISEQASIVKNTVVKRTALGCSTIEAAHESIKTSDVVNGTTVLAVRGGQPNDVIDSKPMKNGASEETVQLNCETETCKEGAPTPTLDVHSVSDKSRPALSTLTKSVPSKSLNLVLCRKLRKKAWNSRVLGMYLSTKILYGASLSLKKRKACKIVKQAQKNVLLEPSLADARSANNADPTTSRRNMGVALESATASLGSDLSNISASCSTQLQNGVTTPLTGVLEQTTVAHWEGVQLSCEIMESNGPAESFSIGYVPDEWDEEYDRGKRKKVRGPKNSFGGPNPFQEVAMKKAKRRRQN